MEVKAMKNVIIGLLMMTCISEATVGQVTFQKTFGSPNADAGNYVQQTSDGGYIIAGFATNFIAGAGQDAYLVKTDANGSLQWSKTYGGTVDEVASSVNQTSDGGYIISGYRNNLPNGLGAFGFLLRTDVNGDTLWTKTFIDLSLESAEQTADGGFIVAGFNSSLGGSTKPAYLIKLDDQGNVLWEKAYSQYALYNDLTFTHQTADGNYITCSYMYDPTGGGYYAPIIIKSNTAGDTLWTKGFGGTHIYSIQQTNDGGYIIGGDYNNGNQYVGVIVKINANGKMVWSKQFGTNVKVQSVQQKSNGEYIAILIDVYPISNAYLLHIDGNGTFLWSKEFKVTDIKSLKQTKDAGFVIVGTTTIGKSNDIYLLKTDSNGTGNCNAVSYLMSSASGLNPYGTGLKITSASLTTGYFSGYVNSPSTSDSTICSNISLVATTNSTNSINITSNTTWTASSDQTWLTLSIASGNGNKITTEARTALVTIQTPNGVQIVTVTQAGTSTTGIVEVNNNNLTIFPNPATNTIVIDIPLTTKESNISIFDINGRELIKQLVGTSKTVINISTLPRGIYFVKVISEIGASVGRFIKD
jgi:hypothetical protein